MKQKHADYEVIFRPPTNCVLASLRRSERSQVISYPKSRRFLAAAFRSTHHTPMMHGLLEVDVSRARLPQGA
jgi:hypothetical protein